MSAETIDQWYSLLQETYDKWSSEVERLKSENEDGSLNKQINQILPTLERYRYYLDQKPLQETTTQQETPDLIQFD
jgi:DNA integrity scanning protein DisA with diadenylate cyclase activity